MVDVITPSQLAKWLAGDDRFNEAVLQQYERLMYGLARNMCAPEDVEDMVQECKLIAIFVARGKYDAGQNTSFATFLRSWLRSRLDQLNRQWRCQVHLWGKQAIYDDEPEKEDGYECDYVAEVRLSLLQLNESIDLLPLDHAFVIRAKYGIRCRTYSQLEIAEQLGRSRETIRLYEKRALAALREMLTERFGEDALADIL
jgi:RNA polymerase sigma factor (sigma-70 family)